MHPGFALSFCLYTGLSDHAYAQLARNITHPYKIAIVAKLHLDTQGAYDLQYARELDPKKRGLIYASLSATWACRVLWLELDVARQSYQDWLLTENPERLRVCFLHLRIIEQLLGKQFGRSTQREFWNGNLPHVILPRTTPVVIGQKRFLWE